MDTKEKYFELNSNFLITFFRHKQATYL